eukprot:6470291-Amphidinium_carterae.1
MSSFTVQKSMVVSKPPTCTYCFAHCMMLSVVEEDPRRWQCQAVHDDKVVAKAIKLAFVQVQSLDIPLGCCTTGEIDESVPGIGAMHFNVKVLAAGL